MAQGDIRGQVVDGSGNPVSGAIVELTKSYQSSPTDEEAVRRTTTDSNGNYVFYGHPDGDGTTQEWHVAAYNYDGSAYVNSFNNPGVTADLTQSLIPDSVVDNFDDGPDGIYASDEDVTTYYSTFGGANIDDYNRQTSVVESGSHALGMSSASAADGLVSYPGDGLNNYPEQGDVWELYTYLDTSDKSPTVVHHWGVPSGDSPRTNSYRITANDVDGDGLRLWLFSNGDVTNLATSGEPLPDGEWVRIEISWGIDDTITVLAEDSSGNQIDAISATDSDSNIDPTGGIGITDANKDTSGTTYIDTIQLI